jgi:hypothetical protein
VLFCISADDSLTLGAGHSFWGAIVNTLLGSFCVLLFLENDPDIVMAGESFCKNASSSWYCKQKKHKINDYNVSIE